MAIFLLGSTENYADISNILASEFSGDFYQLTNNQWLIAHSGTTKDVYNAIDPTSSGAVGNFIVVKVDSYYGWHDADVWEWIQVKAGD